MRVMVFNAVNAYIHALIRRRYTVEAIVISTAFALAASYVGNFHRSCPRACSVCVPFAALLHMHVRLE